MKKRQKGIILSALVLTGLLAMLAVSASALPIEHGQEILSEMSIMQGFPDGDFHLDENLTRAQFAKIAVAASAYRNNVATASTISPFGDVPYSHWAAPYILTASQNGLVAGYPDATYRPEAEVTYEEVITVMLRLLGYTNEDFGSSWPYGQVGLAQNLELTEDVNSEIGLPMTRGQVMQMLLNTLDTAPKTGNSTYLETFRYQYVEDVVLEATAEDDTAVGQNKVKTSAGTYKFNGQSFDRAWIKRQGDVLLKNGDELAAFFPEEQQVTAHQVYSLKDGDIYVNDGGSVSVLELDDDTTVYHKTQKTTLGSLKNGISEGDVITVYRNENGFVLYALYEQNEMEGPVVVTSGSALEARFGFSRNSVTVVRDDDRADFSDIKPNDAAYYQKALDTLWVYSKKVTGILEAAAPDRINPTSVTISGKTYEIDSVEASKAFSATGNYRYGDTVSVVLGRQDKIAGVVGVNAEGETVICYLLESGTKSLTRSDGSQYAGDYVRVVLVDGTEMEVPSVRDYSGYIHEMKQMTIKDGKATMADMNTPTLEGTVDFANRTIGNKRIASEIRILEFLDSDAYVTGTYYSVFLQRLDGVKISEDNLYYYTENSAGEIDCLFLKNITNDHKMYGVVAEQEKMGTSQNRSYRYQFDMGGTLLGGSNDLSATLLVEGTPVMVELTNNQVSSVRSLHSVEDGISEVQDAAVVTESGETLRLSDKVVYFLKDSQGNFTHVTLSDFQSADKKKVSAYFDREEEYGGRVRVIIGTLA